MLTDNESVGTTLISGDPELCKQFLFKTAVAYAKDGHRVFYFTSKPWESLPPDIHDEKEPSAVALKTFITFNHTPTYVELAGCLIKLHMLYRKLPSLILVEGLDDFAAYPGVKGCSRELHVARCCGLILNSAANCSKLLKVPVHVYAASFSNEENYHQVYKGYFKNRWICTSEPGESGEDEGRRVWTKREDGSKALEFHRLDDAVLVRRRVFDKNDDDS